MQEINGYIKYYELTEWWIKTFSEDERLYITNTFNPLNSSPGCLVNATIDNISESKMFFLTNLSTWFKNENNYTMGFRIINKAEEFDVESSDILDIHFMLQAKIELYYKWRDNTVNLEKAILACKKQISLSKEAKKYFKKENKKESLPSHKGLEQLSIIEEKKGEFKNAIALCEKALIEGWFGDWESRINRCLKKNKI